MGEGRGPRPTQVVDFAEGVDTGHQRYGKKFELISVSLSGTKYADNACLQFKQALKFPRF